MGTEDAEYAGDAEDAEDQERGTEDAEVAEDADEHRQAEEAGQQMGLLKKGGDSSAGLPDFNRNEITPLYWVYT